jgi:hypothetical protein
MKTQTKPVNAPPKVKVDRQLTKPDLERVVGGESGSNETHTRNPT